MNDSTLDVYEVELSSGSKYLLAPNSESAAWSALKLSSELNEALINVKQRDGQEILLPK
jgi:hypothetical protein